LRWLCGKCPEGEVYMCFASVLLQSEDHQTKSSCQHPESGCIILTQDA
jgi:hypothetical protein